MQRRSKHRSPKRETAPYAIGFVGGGNMAAALIRGLITAGVYRPDQLCASDVDAQKRATLHRRLRIDVTADNTEVARGSKLVVLAVKPQIIDQVLTELRVVTPPSRVFLSIAAGVTTARLEGGLGEGRRVLRVMPNTPALVGKGISVLVRGRHATSADARLGLRVLRAVGAAVAVEDEGLLDAVTGLSGSGPAYVYLFAESLIAGGIKAGLPTPLATQLALHTLSGAAAMLQETGESPQALRAMVTSPGGTTLAGLGALAARGFQEAVVAAVETATHRSRELGGR